MRVRSVDVPAQLVEERRFATGRDEGVQDALRSHPVQRVHQRDIGGGHIADAGQQDGPERGRRGSDRRVRVGSIEDLIDPRHGCLQVTPADRQHGPDQLGLGRVAGPVEHP